MSAIPLIPGHAYRVRYQGQFFTVLATHPCTAIRCVLAHVAVDAAGVAYLPE